MGSWTSLTGGDRIACGGCGGSCYGCWGLVAGTVTTTPTTPPDGPYANVTAGDNFVCGVAGATRICWGDNTSGQIGDGTSGPMAKPPEFLDNGMIQRVVAAGLHACALHPDESVSCWGSNALGESARPATMAEPTPHDIGLGGCSAIAVASRYACALCAGMPFCWGTNGNGELGRGVTSPPDDTPAQVNVPPGLTFKDIVAGETRACALEQSGELFCWGYGPRGELGTGGYATNLPTPLGPRR
jgi:alpha-tubulin suppressor-like RCC1 family protein